MQDIDYPTPEDNGWQLTDDGFIPLCVYSSQFSPSLYRKPQRKLMMKAQTEKERSS